MKYYVIAGEPSGDLHASNFMRELKELDHSADFYFLGGDLMEQVANRKPTIHIRQMAFMGFVDVAKNLGKIKQNFKIVKQDIEITLHCRMALVIRVGSRPQLPLVVTHCDPDMSTALLLTELVLGDDAEPYTLSRRIVAPGGSQHLALEDADVLVTREVEEVGDA